MPGSGGGVGGGGGGAAGGAAAIAGGAGAGVVVGALNVKISFLVATTFPDLSFKVIP